MATYAAFKHVELYNVGRTKKRVLRPPGGGSSDIFGAGNPGTPRNVRNHMASNIFGSTQDAPVKNNVRQGMHRYYFIGDARRGGKNGDSYNRLFGESDRPFTPAKNHLKSNIPLGGDNAAAKATNGNGIPTNGHTNGKSDNNNSGQNGVSKTGYRRKIKIEANPKHPPTLGETNQAQSSQEQSVHKLCNSNKSNSSIHRDINYQPSANESSKFKAGNESNVFEEATDNLSIAAKNNIVGAISHGNIGVTSRKQINDNTDMNGINDSGIHGDSSSTTTSSVVSPISGMSTDTTDRSNKSTASSSCSLRSPRNLGGLRNPVTGVGIEIPLYKRTRVLRRDGNPVTGEGYNGSGAAEVNTAIPSLNGAKQVINKNRIPPGGFSSGLW